MLYVIEWSYEPEQKDEINKRFTETGAPPPEGIRMIGRWHHLAGGTGVAVCESDNPEAVAKWAQEWNGLMTLDVWPAMDDETAARVIS